MITTARQLKDLIRNLSKKKSADAQILMRNYMMERFLERISLSEYKNQFILKGGMLVAAMVGLDARATMDLDATIKGTNVSVEDVEMIISQIISIPLDDGVSFRIKRISEIMEEADYPGVRVSMETKFDGVITPLKIDISTGDIITPRDIFSPHQSGEFFFHFIHLTGGEEAAASDVNAKNGFLILQRKICLMQDGTVAADGQDDVGARKAFFQRKVLYTFHVAGLFQVIPHQDDSFLHQQELRCPAGSVGSLFLSGVWRNVNSHRAVYSSVSQQIYLSRELWLAATTCSATESSSTPGCSLFWTNIRYSMLPSGPLTGLKSSPRTTKPFAAA